MNKNEFFNKLENYLLNVPEEDRIDIIDSYKEQIENEIAQGKTEKEVIGNLEHPKDIADNVINELGYEDMSNDIKVKPKEEVINNRNSRNVSLFILVQIFNVLILISLVVAAYSVLISFGVTGISLLLASPFSFGFGFGLLSSGIFLALLSIGAGIILINVSILGLKYLTKILIRYVKWNVSLVRGY